MRNEGGADLVKIGYILFVLSVGLLVTSADAQNATTTNVSIRVVDSEGAAINAQIRMAPNPPQALPDETAKDGILAFALPQGSYDLLIASRGFLPQAKHLDLHAEPITVSVVMSVCPPEVCRDMIADKIPISNSGLLISNGPLHIQIISQGALKSLPHKTVTVHNPHENVDETYSGVLLIDLLKQVGAPVGKDVHGKALAEYVVATGSDGYKAVLALAEVEPDFHPGDVLVADSMGDKPLDAKIGPFRLVVTDDKRPARSVRNLVSVELKSAE
jgi:hypothetical protein